MAGLDLNAERSGKLRTKRYRLFPKRESRSRHALYQAALIASTRNKEFQRYYAQQLAGREKEKGSHQKKSQAGSKTLGHCLDDHEEGEPFDFYYFTQD
jgi:hypothetical protein